MQSTPIAIIWNLLYGGVRHRTEVIPSEDFILTGAWCLMYSPVSLLSVPHQCRRNPAELGTATETSAGDNPVTLTRRNPPKSETSVNLKTSSIPVWLRSVVNLQYFLGHTREETYHWRNSSRLAVEGWYLNTRQDTTGDSHHGVPDSVQPDPWWHFCSWGAKGKFFHWQSTGSFLGIIVNLHIHTLAEGFCFSRRGHIRFYSNMGQCLQRPSTSSWHVLV